MRRHDRKPPDVRALGQIGLDRVLNRRRLDELARHTDVITVRPGTVLARAGCVPRQFVAVVDGRVDVTGQSGALHVAGPGTHIGGPELLHRLPHQSMFVTRTECLLVVIHGNALATIDPPAVARWVADHRLVVPSRIRIETPFAPRPFAFVD